MADYSLLNDPDMKEIFDSFIVETKEIFEQLDVDLVELESRPDDADFLNKIFRAFHTIKGTSGFLGLEKLQKITHRCEDILNKLRKGEVRINPEIMDGILIAFDSMKELVGIIETQKNEEYPVDDVIDKLQMIIDGMNSGGSQAKQPEVKVSAVKETSAKLTEIEPEEKAEVAPDKEEKAEKEADFEKIEIQKQPMQISAAKADDKKTTASKGENTIRVDVERLDDLLNIVSELVLGRNMLSQINSEAGLQYEGTKLARDLAETTRQIDLMTTELQLSVMKTRMIKIGKVFNRFPRLVRDLAKQAEKDIQLVIKGEETELDKTLIEEINDPLVHLIRNSADHGIELPADREKKGKNPRGTVIMSAEHEGNNIIITVEDDGNGIDPEKIKNKAISKGLISAEKAAELSDSDALNLIFFPGFSTAEKVTNVSGRGVGMDVVKTNVTKLRGIINIESQVGIGTKFIIKLPLTLAIIQGLLVNVREEIIVIPLSSVIEVVRVAQDKIYYVNQNEVIKLRDRVLPLLNIDKILYENESELEGKEFQYVVIVGIAEKKFGIKVDGLIGQKEVVIKSLGKYLGNIEGIAGSAIMGDGKVVMIVDIAEIVNKMAIAN
ncbi:MAG: chemotaxis protein CheA [Ignavibacteria bacterium]|nr:chemotaxis protein CheA [Ignavibacteria bacterium]